jgi:hypothetical protein
MHHAKNDLAAAITFAVDSDCPAITISAASFLSDFLLVESTRLNPEKLSIF